MRTSILFFALVWSLGQTAWGALNQDDVKTGEAIRKNVTEFRDWMMKRLSQFPKTDSIRAADSRRNYAYAPRGSNIFTADQYNQAGKSNWAKSQIMDSLSILSRELSKTAGTAFAPNSADQLRQYAAQLKQSDDLDFQRIGALYDQQAQALKAGDIQAADRISTQVSAIPKPYVPPGYRPTQGESALVRAFNQVIGAVLASLGGILGTFVVSQLLNALGIKDLRSLIGTGRTAGSAVISGQNLSKTMDNAGASAVRTSGGVAIQKLGTINVKPRQDQDSANAGGAPSAQ